jgi:hypothetical protein
MNRMNTRVVQGRTDNFAATAISRAQVGEFIHSFTPKENIMTTNKNST